MFGGHETASYGFMDSWDSGQCVCWLCGERARKQNEDFMKKNPPPPRVAYYPYKKGEEK
jgi:hypothetical protein